MCNLSQGIRARGIEEGISIGKNEGIAEGIAKCVKNLIEAHDKNIVEAMDILGVTDDMRASVLENLKKNK